MAGSIHIDQKGEPQMTDTFQQYRFARIEGHNITLARLDAHFKNGLTDIAAFERTIAEQLTLASTSSAPWRISEIQQTAFREGARLAVLEFYWAHRRQIEPAPDRHQLAGNAPSVTRLT
jgi:hypothetical protein